MHSPIAPSSAGIWGKPGGCTGWVLMTQLYPSESTPDSLAGDSAHELATKLIDNPDGDFIGQKSSNGLIYDDDMFKSAMIYAIDVIDLLNKIRKSAKPIIGIENKVRAPQIHKQSHGTIDCWIYNPMTKTLWIWDFKHGHDVVEVFENWQLINYTAGLIWKLKLRDTEIIIVMRLVQPRAYHREGVIREWVVRGEQLRSYFNDLHYNAHIALSNDAVTNPGKHCKNCSARTNCKAALDTGTALYTVATMPTPVELDNYQLSTQLAILTDAYDQIKALKKGYETRIESLIAKGENIPGWLMHTTHGRLQWNHSYDDVVNMGDMFDVDLRKKEAITPTQASKTGIDKSVIMAYSKRSVTGHKLTQDDGAIASKVFNK